MTKEEFKKLWEANSCGSGITCDDIAECAIAWGISSHPRTRPIDEITYRVLKAAQTNDAEEYNPNPAQNEREEIGCGYCIHEEVCEMRKTRTKSTRELAKECGHFIHYIVLDESTDWEQRRYEIAKALLPIAYNLYFSNKDFEKTVEGGIDEEHPEFLQVINEYVLEQTDELIKQLKGG